MNLIYKHSNFYVAIQITGTATYFTKCMQDFFKNDQIKMADTPEC